MIRRALVAIARALPAILLIVALFLPWWSVSIVSNFGDDHEDVRPFDPGRFDDEPDDDGLTFETWLTGSFALIAIAAGLAQALISLLEPRPGMQTRQLVLNAMATLALIVAILITAFAWPAEPNDGHFDFFDDESQTQQAGPITIRTRIITQGGLGWWFAVAAALAHTTFLGLGIRDLRRRSAEALSTPTDSD
jgi:hypothetical protein